MQPFDQQGVFVNLLDDSPAPQVFVMQVVQAHQYAVMGFSSSTFFGAWKPAPAAGKRARSPGSGPSGSTSARRRMIQPPVIRTSVTCSPSWVLKRSTRSEPSLSLHVVGFTFVGFGIASGRR